jgi:hypothetical protein
MTEQAPTIPEVEQGAEGAVPAAWLVEPTEPRYQTAQPVEWNGPSTSAPTSDSPETSPSSNAESSNATIPESVVTTPEPTTNTMMVDMMADMDEDAARAALVMSAGDTGLGLAALIMDDIGDTGMGGTGAWAV